MISPRTKDEVTLAASERLFRRADTPEAMAELTEEEIGSLIFPAGFYRVKARYILETSRKLIEDYSGRVPSTLKDLLNLPGVGLKIANLTLSLGFDIDAICVDIHVHRISNRNGWVATKTPEETEKELSKILPKRYWREINELLVRFGKTVCTPVSPFCGTCGLKDRCPRVGITRSR
ncbi:MAG: endonuclease III [Spirochaetales bacterium]|nr:endonuclease III [Spirochaetales bacterium]